MVNDNSGPCTALFAPVINRCGFPAPGIAACLLVGWPSCARRRSPRMPFITFRVMTTHCMVMGWYGTCGERQPVHASAMGTYCRCWPPALSAAKSSRRRYLSLALTLRDGGAGCAPRQRAIDCTVGAAGAVVLGSLIEYSSAALENALAHALGGSRWWWRGVASLPDRPLRLDCLRCAVVLLVITRHDFCGAGGLRCCRFSCVRRGAHAGSAVCRCRRPVGRLECLLRWFTTVARGQTARMPSSTTASRWQSSLPRPRPTFATS